MRVEPISVNLIRLTKLEGRIVQALSQKRPREEWELYPEEGNDTRGIAKLVYGEEVFYRERRGGRQLNMGPTICYAAKSSLSRSLNKLWKEGIVKKCFPKYNSGWIKEVDVDGSEFGWWGQRLNSMEAVWINKNGAICHDLIRVRSLPSKTRIWWILTPLGYEFTEEGSP